MQVMQMILIEMAAIRIYRIIAILYSKTAILCALFRFKIPDAFFLLSFLLLASEDEFRAQHVLL